MKDDASGSSETGCGKEMMRSDDAPVVADWRRPTARAPSLHRNSPHAMTVTPVKRLVPAGNAKEDGKSTRSQSQNAPRLFHAVIEVKAEGEGEHRLSGSVCWGGGDIIGRERPIIIGGGVFVGAGSPSMSVGGSFVVDGEPPSIPAGGSFVEDGDLVLP